MSAQAHPHDHGHPHGHGHAHHHATDRIGVAFALNVGFTLIELVGAWLTNSTAIAADAVHDLGDSLALGFAWGMEGLADRPGDGRYTFGFRRLSLVSALVGAIVLLAGGGLVLLEAVPRLWAPEPADPRGMLGLAVLGVAVNGLAAWRMMGGTTLNERVVSWHLLEDVLGWVAVLVISLVMLVADVPILDPLLAVGLSVFVGYQAIRNLRATLRLFLQATPDGISPEGIRDLLCGVEGVRGVQHLHVWSQDGASHVLTARLDVDEGASFAHACEVREAARHALAHAGIGHATLEVHVQGRGEERCGATG